MTLSAHTIDGGTGWFVQDVRCTAGPGDPPYEEQHGTFAVAAVVRGTFRYRASEGSALMVPGAVLLGNHGSCFECGHEHGRGDRCVSFHFTGACWEALVAAVPGARRATFRHSRLPPLRSLLARVAALEAALDPAALSWEEAALDFAATVVQAEAGLDTSAKPPTDRDARRIAQSVRRIEAAAGEPVEGGLALAELARGAAMSPWHFLRTFRAVVGMTPHQYVLRTRLHQASVRLRTTACGVATIAFDAGFNDLSTFNRHFRRAIGTSPATYRRRHLRRRAGRS